MTTHHPLDRPVWNALRSGWTHLAEGDGRALRLQPDHGPFGAWADLSPESLAAFAALIPEGGELWAAEIVETAPPPATHIVRTGELTQMVCEAFVPMRSDAEIVDLTEADALEMRALALMTEPGPFHVLTHRLGAFVGIKEDGKLVAMAGERMLVDRFHEISAVCTHPDHRGRGHAGALMSVVAQRMIDRGETPFLHSYASNAGAIALYERLGFRIRSPMIVTMLARDE